MQGPVIGLGTSRCEADPATAAVTAELRSTTSLSHKHLTLTNLPPPLPPLMAIARYSSKRTYDEAVFDRLHALPPCKQGPDIARWVIAVDDSEDGHDDALPSAKRRRVLRSLSTTSQRLNPATRNMAAVSPTRRSTRDRSPPKKDVMVATRRKGRQGPPEEADADADADAKRSAADAFSEGAPSFPAPASSLRSLSPPKKKTASTKADLAYLNPNIEFLPLRNIEEIDISLPKSVMELWSRCEVRCVLVYACLSGHNILTALETTARSTNNRPPRSSHRPRL